MKNYFAIAFLLFIALSSCNKVKKLNSTEYIRWVENPDNELKKEKIIGKNQYKVFYKPAQYVALREQYNQKNGLNNETLNVRIEELKNIYYFNFDIVAAEGKESILNKDKLAAEEYSARLNYLVSYAQSDFKVVQNTDTLPCVVYHFEQTFNLSPLNTISLGFEKPKTDGGDIQLIFNNRLFNSGEVKFLFTEDKLKNLPILKL